MKVIWVCSEQKYFCKRGWTEVARNSLTGKSAWRDRWRICFEFRKGDAYEVEIVDYHRG
jgi:hypothetical protein